MRTLLSFADTLSLLAVIAVLAFAAYLVVTRDKRRQRRSRRSLSISDTRAAVTEINQIAELVTASFFLEKIFVEKKTKPIMDNKLSNLVASAIGKEDGLLTDEVCLIAKGQVRAGYNFRKISPGDITVNGKVLTIKLPDPEIIETIINPKGWDFYVEEGNWSDSDVVAVKSKAKDAITKEALDMGILALAATSGKKKIRSLFMSFGFSDVLFV